MTNQEMQETFEKMTSEQLLEALKLHANPQLVAQLEADIAADAEEDAWDTEDQDGDHDMLVEAVNQLDEVAKKQIAWDNR